MLFQDPIYAASKDMEQNLWKTCFYRKIEEFRKRIRKYAAAASSAETKCVLDWLDGGGRWIGRRHGRLGDARTDWLTD